MRAVEQMKIDSDEQERAAIAGGRPALIRNLASQAYMVTETSHCLLSMQLQYSLLGMAQEKRHCLEHLTRS